MYRIHRIKALPVHCEPVQVNLSRGGSHKVQSLAELCLERCLIQTEMV